MGDSIFAGLAIMGRDTNDVFSEYRGLRYELELVVRDMFLVLNLLSIARMQCGDRRRRGSHHHRELLQALPT
jgi:hypothetical protein